MSSSVCVSFKPYDLVSSTKNKKCFQLNVHNETCIFVAFSVDFAKNFNSNLKLMICILIRTKRDVPNVCV